MGSFLVANPSFFFLIPFAGLTSIYLIISYFVGAFSKSFEFKTHEAIVGNGGLTRLSESQVTVDIYHCICGEDLEIIEAAIDAIAVACASSPYKTKYFILCDSKDNAHYSRVSQMAQEHQITVIRRANLGEMKKAGNLRYAFTKTNGQFIVIFDADFRPRHDFMIHTIPYFIDDHRLAILQTPQYFNLDEQYTWISKGAAFIQELFYRMINVNRETFGAAICVGTNAVYRRSALEPFGGTAAVDYSEDVRTGFKCLAAGWRIKYIPVVLASGENPDTIDAYVSQQHRWAMGSISLMTVREFWDAPITTMQRLCYLSGMFYYITTGIGIFLGYIPAILMLAFYPEKMVWFAFFFSLPSMIFGMAFMAWWSRFKWGTYSIKCRTLSYYAHFLAMWEKVTGSITPWTPSGAAAKTKIHHRFYSLLTVNTVLPTLAIFFLFGLRFDHHPVENMLPSVIVYSFYTYFNFSILFDIRRSLDR